MSACELCDAAPLTTWWYQDDECWVAECESCGVPMVVWRVHDASPPADVRARLHAHLDAVAAAHLGAAHWVDETLRTIPDHYHAHARPRRGPFGSVTARRDTSGR